MKTNQQVIDAWLRRERSEGRNIFTDGTIIYSYGYHFPIARILPNGGVLYNKTRYSNTTSKHQCHVRRSIGRRNCIVCHAIDYHTNEVRTKNEIRSLLLKIPKCRKLDDRVWDIKMEIDRYERYCDATEAKTPQWVLNIKFAINNLKGKSIRAWAKNYVL